MTSKITIRKFKHLGEQFIITMHMSVFYQYKVGVALFEMFV